MAIEGTADDAGRLDPTGPNVREFAVREMRAQGVLRDAATDIRRA